MPLLTVLITMGQVSFSLANDKDYSEELNLQRFYPDTEVPFTINQPHERLQQVFETLVTAQDCYPKRFSGDIRHGNGIIVFVDCN